MGIGYRIQKYRERIGLKQEELVEKVDLSLYIRTDYQCIIIRIIKIVFCSNCNQERNMQNF